MSDGMSHRIAGNHKPMTPQQKKVKRKPKQR